MEAEGTRRSQTCRVGNTRGVPPGLTRRCARHRDNTESHTFSPVSGFRAAKISGALASPQKGRKIVAHGISHGKIGPPHSASPGRGERNYHQWSLNDGVCSRRHTFLAMRRRRNGFFRPSRACGHYSISPPIAHAMGYGLSPATRAIVLSGQCTATVRAHPIEIDYVRLPPGIRSWESPTARTCLILASNWCIITEGAAILCKLACVPAGVMTTFDVAVYALCDGQYDRM